MGKKTIVLLVLGVFTAYRVYTPLPDDVEEPWKLTCLSVMFKIAIDLVSAEFH